MKKLCYLFLICMVAAGACAYELLVPATMGCRTDIPDNRDTNHHDSSKLSIRSDASASKSWIRFDLSVIPDANDIRDAVLRLTLHEDEGDFYFNVSAVNDDCTDNQVWVDHPNNEDPANGIYALTWNNAPGNIVTNDGVNPADSRFTVEDLQKNLDPDKTTLIGAVDLKGNYLAGSQHFINVFDVIDADTDGIVQFALHNADSLISVATWDHGSGEEYYPTLIVTLPPAGADYPNPEDDSISPATLPELSWTNPDPNNPGDQITCTVYLSVDDGEDPNRLEMNSVSLNPGENSVSLTQFPALVNDTPYIWIVDCTDPNKGLIEGEAWRFFAGQAPEADAGPDQTAWLGMSGTAGQEVILLSGTTSDDGAYTTQWTQTAGTPKVTINSADQDQATVTFEAAGDYEFTLTADDGNLATSDSVRIVIGEDACDASHIETVHAFNAADTNEDCIVDLTDLLDLIVADWLNCTDGQMGCE